MKGLRVVELGVWIAGPSAAVVLADWGADVIKIEPVTGDPLRSMRATLGDVSNDPFFDPDNRGKRSIILDLSLTTGRAIANELIDRADVFVTNLRPAALARLGLDHDKVLARHPRLGYALITGYGIEGPDAANGAYDMGAYWARGGVAALLTAQGGDPPVQRSGMGDHGVGITVAGMVSAALFSREQTGNGQLVTTSLLRFAAWQVSCDINMKTMIDRAPAVSDRTTAPNPVWNNYRSADGRWFWLIGVEADRHWPQLVRIVSRPKWVSDERYATRIGRAKHAREIIAALDDIFATRTLDQWSATFATEPNFFWSPVNTVEDMLADQQFHASGALVDVPAINGTTVRMVASPGDFHGTPVTIRSGAPTPGQHTDEIIGELAHLDSTEQATTSSTSDSKPGEEVDQASP